MPSLRAPVDQAGDSVGQMNFGITSLAPPRGAAQATLPRDQNARDETEHSIFARRGRSFRHSGIFSVLDARFR